MRKLLLLSSVLLISTALLAQKGKGNQQKSRDVVLGTGSTTGQPAGNKKDRDKEERTEQGSRRGSDPVWEGTTGYGGAGKASKNQPAKVRAAFARDYPNATGVSWSKYRGDWTASFNHGATRSTAVYHANGERRDTRTAVPQAQVPRSIFERIMQRSPGTRLGDAVRIEAPRVASDIFRIKTTLNGTTRYLFYNAQGKEVSYDY